MRKKTKILILALAGFMTVTIGGCKMVDADTNKDTVQSVNTSTKYSAPSNTTVYDYIDPDTGVHYLIYSNKFGNAGAGGITPRLNKDGTIMVDEQTSQE